MNQHGALFIARVLLSAPIGHITLFQGVPLSQHLLLWYVIKVVVKEGIALLCFASLDRT